MELLIRRSGQHVSMPCTKHFLSAADWLSASWRINTPYEMQRQRNESVRTHEGGQSHPVKPFQDLCLCSPTTAGTSNRKALK